MKKLRSIFAAALLLTGCAAPEQKPREGLSVIVGDTGKSDFILIQAEGCTVVNDAAYYDSFPQVSALLQQEGITHIDAMILSHYDKDHIGGAAEILRNYEVDRVIMPDYFSGSEYWLDMITVLEDSGTEQLVISEDMAFTLGQVSFRISAPQEPEYSDENDYSLITEVGFGKTRFLLTGDALEKRLGEFCSGLSGGEHYDVIKMPHHGDYFGALGELTETTSPEYAVITSAENKETVQKKTLRTLEKAGCQVLFTCEGTVRFFSNGETVSLQ